MITIVKGNEKIVCTYGTYEDQYKQHGYLPASEINEEATNKVASSLKSKKIVEDEEDNNEEQEKLSTKYGLKSKKSTTTSKKEEK